MPRQRGRSAERRRVRNPRFVSWQVLFFHSMLLMMIAHVVQEVKGCKSGLVQAMLYRGIVGAGYIVAFNMEIYECWGLSPRTAGVVSLLFMISSAGLFSTLEACNVKSLENTMVSGILQGELPRSSKSRPTGEVLAFKVKMIADSLMSKERAVENKVRNMRDSVIASAEQTELEDMEAVLGIPVGELGALESAGNPKESNQLLKSRWKVVHGYLSELCTNQWNVDSERERIQKGLLDVREALSSMATGTQLTRMEENRRRELGQEIDRSREQVESTADVLRSERVILLQLMGNLRNIVPTEPNGWLNHFEAPVEFVSGSSVTAWRQLHAELVTVLLSIAAGALGGQPQQNPEESQEEWLGRVEEEVQVWCVADWRNRRATGEFWSRMYRYYVTLGEFIAIAHKLKKENQEFSKLESRHKLSSLVLPLFGRDSSSRLSSEGGSSSRGAAGPVSSEAETLHQPGLEDVLGMLLNTASGSVALLETASCSLRLLKTISGHGILRAELQELARNASKLKSVGELKEHVKLALDDSLLRLESDSA